MVDGGHRPAKAQVINDVEGPYDRQRALISQSCYDLRSRRRGQGELFEHLRDCIVGAHAVAHTDVFEGSTPAVPQQRDPSTVGWNPPCGSQQKLVVAVLTHLYSREVRDITKRSIRPCSVEDVPPWPR